MDFFDFEFYGWKYLLVSLIYDDLLVKVSEGGFYNFNQMDHTAKMHLIYLFDSINF